jgi:outer membrane lipoprotein-sorting protein
MNKFKAIFLLGAILLPYWCNAQVPSTPMKDIPGFKQKLSVMSSSVKSIQSDFVQDKKLSVLDGMITSRGQFCFSRENNIRWEYNEPYKYLIIISQGKLFVKEDKDHKQYDIQSNKMFQEMNKFISGCIQGDILKNEKDYNTRYFEDNQYYFVSLVPVSEKMRQMLNEIQIWFDKKDLTVSRIRMMEAGGDYTRIDFINKKLNINIPVEKFAFQ